MTTPFTPTYQALIDRIPLPTGARVEGQEAWYSQGDTDLVGYRAVDTVQQGRRPAVLIVPDWYGAGPHPRARAHMIARRGWLGFVVDVYGGGRVISDDSEAAAEASRYYRDPALLYDRVRAAYDAIVADPDADPARIAILGFCFGGMAALEFTRHGDPLVATASFHGTLIPHDPPDVSRIRGSLLIAAGAEDEAVSDADLLAFEHELRSRRDLDWQVVLYAGAPHSFTVPGTDAYRPAADRRSWAALEALLQERFA